MKQIIPCIIAACLAPAIYAHPDGPLCEDHLPADCAFAPFLGQQQKFIASTCHTVGYGGAGGGGKSTCGKMKYGHQLAIEQERYQAALEEGRPYNSRAWGIYFRRKTKDMLQVVERAQVEFRALDDALKFNAETKVFTFPSYGGAKFQFSHMEHRDNRFDHKSSEFTYVFFDELTEFEEEMYDYIETRLRTDDPVLEKHLQICWGSNPDGKHMLWVKRRFFDIAPPETVIRFETELRDGRVVERDQVFIPAKLDDNPKLMASGNYEANLIDKPAHIRRAILEGDWQYAAGAYLAEAWIPDLHVVEDHDVPDGVMIARDGDWGMRERFSIGWRYIDRDGAFTYFWHLTGKGMEIEEVCRKIRDIERMFGLWDDENNVSMLNFTRSPLDAQCFAKHGMSGAVTIAGEFLKHGVKWRPSKKDRYNGAAQILRRLRTMVPAAFKGATHPTERARPMLRFMRRCRSPIETLPLLPPDPNDPNDVDTHADDHDWDMTMYGCLEVPIAHKVERDDSWDIPDDEPTRSKRRGWEHGPWTR
jgi:hypothetical protein